MRAIHWSYNVRCVLHVWQKPTVNIFLWNCKFQCVNPVTHKFSCWFLRHMPYIKIEKKILSINSSIQARILDSSLGIQTKGAEESAIHLLEIHFPSLSDYATNVTFHCFITINYYNYLPSEYNWTISSKIVTVDRLIQVVSRALFISTGGEY